MGNYASIKVIEIKNVIIKIFDGIVKKLCDVRYISYLRKNLNSLGILNCNRFSYKSVSDIMKLSNSVLTVIEGIK